MMRMKLYLIKKDDLLIAWVIICNIINNNKEFSYIIKYAYDT